MNLAFEYLIPVIRQHTAVVIRLQDGEEEHILDVGRGYYSSTLAHRTGWLYPDLFLYFSADDGFGSVGVGRVAGMGHIGMQSVPQELLDDCNWTVLRPGDVPQVGKSLRMAVSVVPRTRQRQLTILVNNLIVFNDKGHGLEVQFIVEGHDVILWFIRLVLVPLPLAGNVGYLVSGQGRSLEKSPSIHQVSDVVGFMHMDGLRELLPMHHGGVVSWPIGSSAKPLQALLHRHPLWNQKRPVHGVQFRVSAHAAVITDVSPEKGTNVGIDVPFPFFLQELEPCGPIFSDGGGSGTAMAGRDAAIGLYLRRIGAVIGREMISGFNSAIPIPESEAVS